MIIRGFDQLCRALSDEMHKMDKVQMREAMADKQSHPYMLSRLFRTYMRAEGNAAKFGYVGVGALVFAEHRMVEFQKRIGCTE